VLYLPPSLKFRIHNRFPQLIDDPILSESTSPLLIIAWTWIKYVGLLIQMVPREVDNILAIIRKSGVGDVVGVALENI
jgi:hypothetical protein